MKYLSLLLFFIPSILWAQQGTVSGFLLDENSQPIPAASILWLGNQTVGTIANLEGQYTLQLPAGQQQIIVSHVQYQVDTFDVLIISGETVVQNLNLNPKAIVLEDVEVITDIETDRLNPATRLTAKSVQNLPSAIGDFNKVLLTLPGVTGNNELSSAYNVRGGNFDENLVYVNDIPVYRPFLANAGRQEGLSFINPNLVNDIRFYSGGWEAKYGDKLSSSLNIDYKEPNALEGELTIGLLGGSAYFGNKISDKVKFLFGARHSDSRYLLNTLETQGQYLPQYTDAQAFFTFDLSKKESNIKRTKLNWLLSYARNRYLTIPVSQTTDFGSVTQNLRIQTGFEGREELNYDTYQSGLNLSHRWSNKVLSRWIASAVKTRERENYDVIGAYRICDLDNNPSSGTFNECAIVRGIGVNFDYGRNNLDAELYNLEWRNEWLVSDFLLLEGGVGVQHNRIEDSLNEYAYLDSAGFISNPFDDSPLLRSVFNELQLNTTSYTSYLQSTIFSSDSTHAINAGLRLNYFDYNNETLISPRVTYRFRPGWEKEMSFRLSIGRYSQHPFYRELRNEDGNIVDNIKPQVSTHYIAAAERVLTWWNRPFLFTVEGYYKDITNAIAYDIDNVRLRYFAENNASAFAYGMDFRINGEFIKDSQSWFSLGILKTREDLDFDNRGYVRRPTDQHITLAFYFEDHLPSDPSTRVYVNTVFGSGFPLGPPNDFQNRNVLNGDEYYRVDIGFSKSFPINNHKYLTGFWIRGEILNALAADNTLSYTWIQDISGNQLAIPNSLSARFLNIKLSASF